MQELQRARCIRGQYLAVPGVVLSGAILAVGEAEQQPLRLLVHEIAAGRCQGHGHELAWLLAGPMMTDDG